MKFLNYIENHFERVLVEDTEFITDSTGTIPESVIAHVYIDVFSGENFKFWLHDKKSTQPPFDFNDCFSFNTFNKPFLTSWYINLN